MGATGMSYQSRKAWNRLYTVLQEHELTSEAYLIKIEILNVLDKAMPDCKDLDKAIMLLAISDCHMHETIEGKNQ